MRSVHRTSCPAPTGLAPRGSRPLDAPRSAGPPASGRGDDEDEVPPSTCWCPAIASRSTVPPTGLVMLASIFIASIVATTPPGSTTSSATVVTTPANGADVPGIRGVRLLGRLDVRGHRAVPHLHRAELAVEGAHDRAHALPVRLADGADPGSRRLPASISASYSLPCTSPWETRRCRARRSPKRSRLSSNSFVGPGKSRWFRVRRGSVRSDSSCSGVSSVVRGLAWRPCSALVRNGSGQPRGPRALPRGSR